MTRHEDLNEIDMHIVHAFTYANESQRLSASGFLSASYRKIAFQEDDKSLWMLTSLSPIEWTRLSNAPRSTNLSMPGPISVTTGTQRWYPATNIALIDLFASVGVASVTDVELELFKNGVSINTVTVPANTNESPRVDVSNTRLTIDDYLTVNSNTAGGENLTLIIRYMED